MLNRIKNLFTRDTAELSRKEVLFLGVDKESYEVLEERGSLFSMVVRTSGGLVIGYKSEVPEGDTIEMPPFVTKIALSLDTASWFFYHQGNMYLIPVLPVDEDSYYATFSFFGERLNDDFTLIIPEVTIPLFGPVESKKGGIRLRDSATVINDRVIVYGRKDRDLSEDKELSIKGLFYRVWLEDSSYQYGLRQGNVIIAAMTPNDLGVCFPEDMM